MIFRDPSFSVSRNLHLTQAERNSLRRHENTSLLFNDAIVVLKMIGALEDCVYLVSCNTNYLKEVGGREKKKVKNE